MTRPVIREMTVVEVQWTHGEGTAESPFRVVYSYFTPLGSLLAERDSWLEPRAGFPDKDRVLATSQDDPRKRQCW